MPPESGSIDVNFFWLQNIRPEWADRFESFLQWTWNRLNVEKVELGVVFLDQEEMAAVNDRFRGIREPTDVLSFPYGESSNGGLEGDLIICPDYVYKNACLYAIGFEEELFRVALHGELHLLGWDHSTNDPEEPMLRYQEILLREYSPEGVD